MAASKNAKKENRRIIALGTSVVRALVSASQKNGVLEAGTKITDLKISCDTNLEILDGIITGMHEEGASHLNLLCPFLPIGSIQQHYLIAVKEGFLWHEYGDLMMMIKS